ncbi:MAG: HD domain-containing protein [Candidatus Berkelbacteria bacterium]|nr:HD domain-containing protein [Candidatus Berkelbacteria bacterium]
MPKSKRQQQVIDQTAKFIRQKFDGEATGHDWYHIERVWKMAQTIGTKEGADPFVVELGALLHDIADWKFHGEQAGGIAARQWLAQHEIEPRIVDHVCEIVDNISFKGLGHSNSIKTLEGQVVQDADRLDAIGAIAIARAFAYGGAKSRSIYDPSVSLDKPLTDKEYQQLNKQSDRSTIHHFYDKLLYLKARLNTKTARQLAVRRHKFMEDFLKEFFEEWEA